MAAGFKATTLKQAARARGPLHLAVGMFDGVHLGHQAVVEAAIHSAKQGSGTAAVLTFHPHPSRLFHPEAPTLLLMQPEQKIRVLRELGMDLIIKQPFTRSFARIEAEHFLSYLKRRLPRLAAIYVGENFRFGRGRRGNIETLVETGREAGVAVVSVARLRRNGRPISSTRVRELLAAGEIAEAGRLLGYTYFCEGTVQAGKRLGRKLGFPTLNIRWAPEAQPAYGVYAVRLRTKKTGKGQRGVANYGMRPTVSGKNGAAQPLLEVHLLGTKKAPGSGQQVRVEWQEFLRPERKFASLDALKAQIGRDCRAAAKYFRKR